MTRPPHRVVSDRLFARINAALVQPARDDAVRGDDKLRRELRTAEARVEKLEREVDGLTRHLPYLLERLGEVNSLGRESRRRLDALGEMASELQGQVGRTTARVEFVRTEFMHELRHGAARPGDFERVETEILNPEKVEAAQDDLRLNLGCGHLPLENYINCDARRLDGVDVVADVGVLPFDDGAVAEIFSAHLLEHFPLEELRRRVLPYWVSLLRQGGELRAVVPDAEKMLEEHAKGDFSFDDLRLVTYGEQEYTGDFHFNMFSRDSLVELLTSAGLDSVEYREVGRRNGRCYEMEIVGRKPGGPTQDGDPR